MELFGKLGLDVRLLVAQLINFGVLLFVLQRFLYRPLVDILDRRRRQVEANEEKEQTLVFKLAEAEALYEERTAAADESGRDIIRRAEHEALERRAVMLEEARAEALRFRSAAEQTLSREREEALSSVAREGEALIRAGVEKVLSSIADSRTTELYMVKAEQELARLAKSK